MKAKTKVLITIFSILIPIITLLVIVIFVPARPEYYNLYFETSKMSEHNKKVVIQGEPAFISYENYSNEFEQIKPYKPAIFFPQEINSGTIECFFYLEKGIVIDGPFTRVEIYLSWMMDADTFYDELVRLNSINLKKNVCFSKDLFVFDSYVAEYNRLSGFEYAILDYDNYAIHYVWLNEVGTFEQMVFNDIFKPSKVLKDSDLKHISKNGSFTIY